MVTSALAQKISVQLLQDILSGDLRGGEHVGAQRLAKRYGVSRTPVRDALALLNDKGVLQRKANRGYFVADTIPEDVQPWLRRYVDSSTDHYQLMADDWLRDRLPEDVTEQFLRQKYGWTKAKVSDLLMRAAREGWAERKEGYGWRYLPVAKTPAAFDQIYRFRMAIEPAAMLEPAFKIDRRRLAEHKRVQQGMLRISIENTPQERLLDNGAEFHEDLIRMSGNPYFLTALQRVNRMRRLMEYRTEIDLERLIVQCGEHLELIALLEKGEVVEASYFMRRHLSGALQRKSLRAWNWPSELAGSQADGARSA